MFGSSGTKKVENLHSKMDQLTSMETDIEWRLKREEIQPGKKRKREVDHWLSSVERKKQDANRITGKIKSASMATEAESMIKEVEQLLEQGSRFSDQGLVLDDLDQLRGVPLLATELKDEISRKKLEEIRDCLFNEDVLRVGICGIGGVRKTTLAVLINNEIVAEASPFHHVYWITVSKETSLYKLQMDISKAAGFDLSSFDDEKIRASYLYTGLKNRKQSLIILDDVWERISMENVGIPNVKGGCKLLITTRSVQVCRAMLCREIKVSPLPKEEAWNLFVDRLMNYDTLSCDVKEIAKLVVEECDGLPLGIKVMATCMRGIEDISEWRHTLTSLKNSTSPFPEMEHFSYKRLNDVRLEKCFLYCALYPEDYSIRVKDLMVYLRVEKLVDITGTLCEQEDQCCTLLSRLNRACLLERSEETCYKMHDLVRDMAVGIMKKDGAIVKAGMFLKEIPNEDFWSSGLTRVSVMCNSVTSVKPLTPPNCPYLTILLLQVNPLESISESFFLQMKCLKILNLSLTYIVSLPEFISELRNLGALILEYCSMLKYIPSLAKLENLSELSLRYSGAIEELPKGVENLGKLRLLDLGNCDSIRSIPKGLTAGLHNLVYLALPWKSKVERENLVMLKHLKRFEGRFYGVDDFNLYVESKHFDQLEHYDITVGTSDLFKAIDKWSDSFTLRYGSHVSTWAFEGFKIIRLNLSSYFDSPSPFKGPFLLPHNVVDLNIRENGHFKYPRPQGLGSVGLNYLPVLEYFCELNLRKPSCALFKNLQAISVHGCSRIDALFPIDVLEHHLPNLRSVTVYNCREMESVFTTGRANDKRHTGESKVHDVTLDRAITHPNLEQIYLIDLPSLKFICEKTIICNSLNRVEICRCTNLKRIPISIQSDGRKVTMCSEQSWWDSCEWDNPSTKQKFCFQVQSSYMNLPFKEFSNRSESTSGLLINNPPVPPLTP